MNYTKRDPCDPCYVLMYLDLPWFYLDEISLLIWSDISNVMVMQDESNASH